MIEKRWIISGRGDIGAIAVRHCAPFSYVGSAHFLAISTNTHNAYFRKRFVAAINESALLTLFTHSNTHRMKSGKVLGCETLTAMISHNNNNINDNKSDFSAYAVFSTWIRARSFGCTLLTSTSLSNIVYHTKCAAAWRMWHGVQFCFVDYIWAPSNRFYYFMPAVFITTNETKSAVSLGRLQFWFNKCTRFFYVEIMCLFWFIFDLKCQIFARGTFLLEILNYEIESNQLNRIAKFLIHRHSIWDGICLPSIEKGNKLLWTRLNAIEIAHRKTKFDEVKTLL